MLLLCTSFRLMITITGTLTPATGSIRDFPIVMGHNGESGPEWWQEGWLHITGTVPENGNCWAKETNPTTINQKQDLLGLAILALGYFCQTVHFSASLFELFAEVVVKKTRALFRHYPGINKANLELFIAPISSKIHTMQMLHSFKNILKYMTPAPDPELEQCKCCFVWRAKPCT